jgi:uncharacterized protein (TIGR02611 family)
MSSSVDDHASRDAEVPTATLPQASDGPHRPGHHSHEHHHHHILIEPDDKRKLAVYRVAVGFLGLILVVLGFVSGPIPGPGGIPLILLGLAVWSSEFEWAHQVMMWLKKELHRYRTWSTARKTLFWVAFFACCGLIGYMYLLVTGPPTWLPGSVDMLLQRLPGL